MSNPEENPAFPIYTTAVAVGVAAAYAYSQIPKASKKIPKTAPVNKADDYSVYNGDKSSFVTTDKTVELPIRFSKSGIASREGTPPMTMCELFTKACKTRKNDLAMRIERPLKPLAKGEKPPPALPADEWVSWTYQQYFDETTAAAKALISLGVQRFDAVAIFGFNAPEWLMGEIASMLAGGIGVGIYPTDTVQQLKFKMEHSESTVAIVGDDSKFERMKALIDESPYLKAIVGYDCPDCCTQDLKRKDGSVVKVYTWAAFLKLGAGVSDADLEARMSVQKPGHCCALVYTSGTTGNPKATMISHDSLVFESSSVSSMTPDIGNDPNTPERIISFLPLSHIAGMLIDILFPLYLTANSKTSCCVSFARVYDLKSGSLGDRLKSVKPTIFLGVPRVYEKISEKLKAVGAATKGIKKKLSTWAKGKGLAHQTACQLGGDGSYPPMYGLADKLVLNKIKQALGLEHCKVAIAGAAPISKDTLEYFASLGIHINEGYGMSESCGCTTMGSDEAHVWGSCGYECPGCEVKVFNVNPDNINDKTECPKADNLFTATEAQQGELCFRGRHIMMGYMVNKNLGKEHEALIAKKTAEAVDDEGWLHSGDKAVIDKRGMVKITGRYKELIIGAGGENVAPVPLEDNLKRVHTGIANVMMVGDKRKFNTLLVTLKAVGATGELPGTNELDVLAKEISPNSTTITEAYDDPIWIKSIDDAIDATNNNGDCCPMNAAKIQRYTILPHDFSIETDEITPSLKTKRSVIEKKYSKMIDAMYAAKTKDKYVKFQQL